ncbi:MAG: hypothetical protein APF81_06485 [Desulfosporosinus sp. BRH_c37]|nr:MAG: hypothetical protein APF81_06485 [Desulfosporosinus sp. BRH_c37]
MKSFGNQDKKVFLWINKEPIEDKYRKQIVQKLNAIHESKGIKIDFASITFKEICRCFNDTLNDYDIEMKELMQDYESFCLETGLIDNADTKMRVVLSGTTYEQNVTNSLYYAPKDRGYQKHKYLGLYKGKAVRGLGEIISIADLSYDFSTNEINVEEQLLGTITETQKDKVKEVIKEAKQKFGYIISQGHRFFFVEKFLITEFIKPTKGGLFGQKYFDLCDIDGYKKEMDTQEIAKLLIGKKWS